MDTSEIMKRITVKETIESQCKSFIEEKIDRYLEIEHQGIIGATILRPPRPSVFTCTVTAISLAR